MSKKGNHNFHVLLDFDQYISILSWEAFFLEPVLTNILTEVLGLLDILLGRELYDVKKPEWYDNEISQFEHFDENWYNSNMAMKTWHYKIDDNGKVIGLYIRNYGERGELGWLNYIPPEICQLKNLKEVSIGGEEVLSVDKNTQKFLDSLPK